MRFFHHKIIKRCSGISATSFCFLVCFLFLQDVILCGPKDSLTQVYEISDPRNPHCPCHKYQKKAEKEFVKATKKEKGNSLSSTEPDQKILRTSMVKANNKRIAFFSTRTRNYKNPAIKKRKSAKRTFKSIFKKDIAACPR